GVSARVDPSCDAGLAPAAVALAGLAHPADSRHRPGRRPRGVRPAGVAGFPECRGRRARQAVHAQDDARRNSPRHPRTRDSVISDQDLYFAPGLDLAKELIELGLTLAVEE